MSNLFHGEDDADSSSSTNFNNVTFISDAMNRNHKFMKSKLKTMMQINDNNEVVSSTILLIFDETIHIF